MGGKCDRPQNCLATSPLVSGLAHTVINRLIDTPAESRERRLEIATKILYSAITHEDRFDQNALRQKLRGLRVNDDDLIDRCIGEAAAILGENWLDDTLSFAEVSIGASNLMGLCREISTSLSNLKPSRNSQTILLATVLREDHLIGPTLLAQKLRRNGHSVRVMNNSSPGEIARYIHRGKFDCLMLSAASYGSLENAEQAIRLIRRGPCAHVPVVLGGAALEFCGDAASSIGADLVTNDAHMALDLLQDTWGSTQVGAAE